MMREGEEEAEPLKTKCLDVQAASIVRRTWLGDEHMHRRRSRQVVAVVAPLEEERVEEVQKSEKEEEQIELL
jgi:hypothetical protein